MRRRSGLCLTMALALLPAVPAGGAEPGVSADGRTATGERSEAAQRIPRVPGIARVRVWVRGGQETDWNHSGQLPGDGCTIVYDGSGREGAYLQSTRPERTVVSNFGGQFSVQPFDGSFTVEGYAERHGRDLLRGCGQWQDLAQGCGREPASTDVVLEVEGRRLKLHSLAPPSTGLSRCSTSCGGLGYYSSGALEATGRISARQARSIVNRKRDHDIQIDLDGGERSDHGAACQNGSWSYRSYWDVTFEAPDGDVIARPGGPYRTERAESVTLDGSRSTAKRGRIKSYEWTFEPLGTDCPPGIRLRKSKERGKKVKIVPLCSLIARLEVTDNKGGSDDDSTTVLVQPRTSGWETPFSHGESYDDPRGPTSPPSVTRVEGDQYAFSFFGGVNVSDCSPRPASDNEIICPHARGGSWEGNGYAVGELKDKDGPFDGFHYVIDSSFDVQRLAALNPTVRPGTEFYSRNSSSGLQGPQFVEAIRQHEGLGNGTPGSGHSQIIRDLLEKPDTDPRRAIEPLIANTRGELVADADEELRRVDRTLDGDSDDPLAHIGTFVIEVYDQYEQRWIRLDGGVMVPGQTVR